MTYSRTQYYSFLRFRYFSRLSIKLTFTFTNLAFMPKIQKSHSSVNLIVTTLEFMGGGKWTKFHITWSPSSEELSGYLIREPPRNFHLSDRKCDPFHLNPSLPLPQQLKHYIADSYFISLSIHVSLTTRPHLNSFLYLQHPGKGRISKKKKKSAEN